MFEKEKKEKEAIIKNLCEEIDSELEVVKKRFSSIYSPERVEEDYNQYIAQLEERAKILKQNIEILAGQLDFKVLDVLARGAKTWTTVPFHRKDRDDADDMRLTYRGYNLLSSDARCSTVFSLPVGYWRLILIALPVSEKEAKEECKRWRGIKDC